MYYVIVFEGLEKNADQRKIVLFFRKELSLEENRIRILLTTLPCILVGNLISEQAQTIQRDLNKFGCRSQIYPVIIDPDYPFPILQKHFKIINREMSKILRTKSTMTLSIIKITNNGHDTILPSLFGPFEQVIEDCFRQSDTIIGIDHDRLIILGFSTDSQGLPILENKAVRVFKQLLVGKSYTLTIGSSVFPQEGSSIRELLNIAESRRLSDIQLPDKVLKESIGTADKRVQENGLPEPQSVLKQCFIHARGRIFKRLIEMDSRVMMLGLSQISKAEQIAFLNRLPYSYPLISNIRDNIDITTISAANGNTEKQFESIIRQMDFEKNLRERKIAMENIFAKLKQIEALPTLPSTATQILDIVMNPDVSIREISEVINHDPSITTKILKIVNSAFYGFPQEINAIDQAVMILGTEEIMNLSIALSSSNVFNIRTEKCMYSPKALWHHSISTALIAANLFKSKLPYEQHIIFTAGLLHDIGKIFLIEHFTDSYSEVIIKAKENNMSFYEMEEDRFDINHGNVGEYLANLWNIPNYYVDAIACHHHPSRSNAHANLAAIIGLADYLYYETVSNGPCENREQISSASHCQLNFAQWNILKEILPDFDENMLNTMKQDTLSLINSSREIMHIMQ
ncbi:MAG: HDOD domain-containing protein [Syntrophaceae bacterium]